jgi:hypothetical protein
MIQTRLARKTMDEWQRAVEEDLASLLDNNPGAYPDAGNPIDPGEDGRLGSLWGRGIPSQLLERRVRMHESIAAARQQLSARHRRQDHPAASESTENAIPVEFHVADDVPGDRLADFFSQLNREISRRGGTFLLEQFSHPEEVD